MKLGVHGLCAWAWLQKTSRGKAQAHKKHFWDGFFISRRRCCPLWRGLFFSPSVMSNSLRPHGPLHQARTVGHSMDPHWRGSLHGRCVLFVIAMGKSDGWRAWIGRARLSPENVPWRRNLRNVHGNLEEQGQDMTVDGWVCAVTGQTLVSPSWTGAWIGMHRKLHATLDIYAGEQRGSDFLYTCTSSFILQL